MSNCQLSEQKRTKASGFKRNCFQSSYLLVNSLTFALNMCQHHFDINIRAQPQAKFFPLRLNLRGLPLCSLTHTVTPLLYRKLVAWKIWTYETWNALHHLSDSIPWILLCPVKKENAHDYKNLEDFLWQDLVPEL